MEQQTKKNRTVWIAVGVVGVLCLVAGVVTYLVIRQIGTQVGQAIKNDPTEMAAVSDKIAQYDLPPGYSTQMSMSILMYDMVVIVPTQPSPNTIMIMLMQFSGSTGVNQEQMQEQVRQSFEQQSGQRGIQMTVVETRQETIRGEQVTVTISESGSAGLKMRQLMTVFTGNGGPTVLMIQGAASDWDDELISNFLHSIR